MRLFVAVPLSFELKDAIREFQHHFTSPGIRHVPEDNLHLTLHFIGNTSDEIANDITQKLTQVANRNHAFELIFQETAPGPTLRSPRLIWTRFQEHPAFAKLATDLCTTLDASPGAHGKFIPHITISRLGKDFRKSSALPVIRDAQIPAFSVSGFALWQSTLQSPHPVYSVLREFSLQAAL